KDEALHFFEFRLELENDFRSLYSILLIGQIRDENQIFYLIKKHTAIFRESSFNTVCICNVKLSDSIGFLLHYDKYLQFRESYPIHRYSDHLSSELYTTPLSFWEILSFIFAKSFSNAITQYLSTNDSDLVVRTILNDLEIATKSINSIFSDTCFPHKEAVEIVAHISVGFPTILIREFGT